MKIANYQISVVGVKGRYECEVEEVHDNGETFYRVDINLPDVKPGGKASPTKYHVEMHFDAEAGGLTIKDLTGDIPADLMEIEERLSDQICSIHN